MARGDGPQVGAIREREGGGPGPGAGWEFVPRGPRDAYYRYTGPTEPEAPPKPPPARHHEAPKAHHGGGGGGGSDNNLALFSALLDQQARMLEMFLAQPSEPSASQPDGGLGFEDTVLTRRPLADEEIRRPGLLPGPAPQRRVRDPITGAVYESPAAALEAGVTSWEYVPITETPVAA